MQLWVRFAYSAEAKEAETLLASNLGGEPWIIQPSERFARAQVYLGQSLHTEAIEELRKMDMWSRLFAVPMVLAASRRMRDEAVAAQTGELLSGIIDSFDRSTADAASRVATPISAGREAGIAALAVYVDAVKAASGIAAGPDPYADLKDRRRASLAGSRIQQPAAPDPENNDP